VTVRRRAATTTTLLASPSARRAAVRGPLSDQGDFKLLAGNMIDENWEIALGGKPTSLHRDGIER
jgi:hypothetical protein